MCDRATGLIRRALRAYPGPAARAAVAARHDDGTGESMADGFGVERAVAQDLARSLGAIRTAMNGFSTQMSTGATGSPRVEAALDRFYRESSDHREALDTLLEHGVQMMQGLADGSHAVDQGLADTLTTSGSASGSSGSPATSASGRRDGPQ